MWTLSYIFGHKAIETWHKYSGETLHYQKIFFPFHLVIASMSFPYDNKLADYSLDNIDSDPKYKY